MSRFQGSRKSATCLPLLSKTLIAARVAATLRQDPTLDVQNVSGRFNELRVEVDGRDVVDTAWYPAPGSLVRRVRASLSAGSSGSGAAEEGR